MLTPQLHQNNFWIVEERSGKKGWCWVVIRDDGWIANGHFYEARAPAAARCELLNLLFGDEDET